MDSTNAISRRPARSRPIGALPLLMTVGSLLAVSVLLSKVAAGLHAPMLTYFVSAMGGAGVVLLLLNGGIGRRRDKLGALVFYSMVAGGLLALGSALGYVTVHKVGAAFIALALAFPPLLTWLLSLTLGMERFDAVRIAASRSVSSAASFLHSARGSACPPKQARSSLLARSLPSWPPATCSAPASGQGAQARANLRT